jgi:hypothetical protein
MRSIFASQNASGVSPRGINGKNPSGPVISEVIADDTRMPMDKDNSMEVMENKEPREERPGVPEWAGDPGVHVIIIRGRGIIGHHRRAFGIIVINDHRWFSVLNSCRRWTFNVSIWDFSNDR